MTYFSRYESEREAISWPPLAAAGLVGFAAGVALLSGRKLGMQMTSAVAADWLRQLKLEHRIAEAIFKAGLKTKPHETGKRFALYGHLYYALLKHGLQEETTIYPALRQSGKAPSADHLAAEHFQIKTYLYRLHETPRDDANWIAIWASFHELVAKHVAEEEDQVFPAFHELMSRHANRKLTLSMNRQGLKLA